jgi:bifunctional non-homologous end joining protein LigD
MITHPDKLLFPEDGVSKGDLAAYYEAVAEVMLPHIAGRPLTMERYPNGIGQKGFMQKDVSRGFPAWLERIEVPKKGGVVHHALINDLRSLLWMANQNTITPHVWISRAPRLYYPDLCVFDLDPAEDDARTVADVALALRDLLKELELASWIKTSGSKGFHIVVPLDGRARMGEVARVADAVGRMLVERDPTRLTQEFSKADRGGRIYVDTGRNGYSATFAAPYAVRPKPGAPVSAPVTWDEVESGTIGPRSFTLRAVPQRVAAVGDPWAELLTRPQSLAEATRRLGIGDEAARAVGDQRSAVGRKPSAKRRPPKTAN